MKGKKDCYAAGGEVMYNAKGSREEKEIKGKQPDEKDEREGNVESEGNASSRKRGGKVEGTAAKRRMDRPGRKSGGACMAKGGMTHSEVKAHSMHHRPGRKAGGRVGADKAPLTEAGNSGKPTARALMADADREP